MSEPNDADVKVVIEISNDAYTPFSEYYQGSSEFDTLVAVKIIATYRESIEAPLKARIEELEALAYLGEHHFPDLTYQVRLAELVSNYRKLEAELAAERAKRERIVKAGGKLRTIIVQNKDIIAEGAYWGEYFKATGIAQWDHFALDAEKGE